MQSSQKKLLFLGLLVLLIILVLYFSKIVANLLILAFFLAYAINPLVEFLQKKGARRDTAIITIYLVLFLVSAFLIGILVPRLINDLTELIKRLPEIFETFAGIEKKFTQVYWRLPINLKTMISDLTARAETGLRTSLVLIAQTVLDFFSQSLLLLIVPVLAYYINRDYPKLKLTTNQWILHNFGIHWTRTFLKLDSVFRLYIRGQLLTTMIVGTLIGIGLSFMGFETAVLLGLVAGVFNLIPYFGPVLGAAPSIILALLKSPWMVLYVIMLFVFVNQLEVIVLTPRIIGGSLGLHPVTVICLILIGGQLGGLLGMIFAVPIGAMALIIIKSFYEISFGLEHNELI